MSGACLWCPKMCSTYWMHLITFWPKVYMNITYSVRAKVWNKETTFIQYTNGCPPVFQRHCSSLSSRPTQCYYNGQAKAINVALKWIMGHPSWGLVLRSCDGEGWRSLLSPMRRPERRPRQTSHLWRHTFHVWQLGLTPGMAGSPLCPAQSISVPERRNWP